MSIVSFETAVELREAGFPQPEYIQIGFGYDETGSLVRVENATLDPFGLGGFIYAPTLADILRELPKVKAHHTFSISFEHSVFVVSGTYNSIGEFPVKLTEHAVAEEAAAQAWLGLSQPAEYYPPRVFGDANTDGWAETKPFDASIFFPTK